MDVVYLCRAGENAELRYSLRSLVNVPHETVHIIGGWPNWVNTNTVAAHPRPAAATKYASTTAHVEYACMNRSISDPFMLWNDDFYTITPITGIPHMHRGNLYDVMRQYRGRPGAWVQGLFATGTHLKRVFPGRTLYSYEVHVPLIVHKQPMLEALTVVRSLPTNAPHKRTLYGNLAGVGGEQIRDPKVSRENRAWPAGPWLSSDDSSFTSLVQPALHDLFPSECRYE